MTRPAGEMERLTLEPVRPDLAEVQAGLQAAAENRPSFSAISQRRVRRRLQDSLQGSQRRRLRWFVVSLCGVVMVVGGVVGATMGPRLAPWLFGTAPDRGRQEDQGKGKPLRHLPVPPDRATSGVGPTSTISPALDPRAPAVTVQTRPISRPILPGGDGLPATELVAEDRGHKPEKPSRAQPRPAVEEPVPDRPILPAVTPASTRPMAMNIPASEPRAITVTEPSSQPWRRLSPAETPSPMPSRSQPALDPIRDDAVLLGEAIHLLRVEGNPRAALAKLDRAGPALSKGAFAPELTVLRIETFLALGRRDSALSALDQLSMSKLPRANEWLVVRAELRGEAGRWRAAEQDFDHAMASGVDALGQDLGERALWGRSVASARLGDSKGARHAAEEYLRRFPHGRFLSEAQRVATPTP